MHVKLHEQDDRGPREAARAKAEKKAAARRQEEAFLADLREKRAGRIEAGARWVGVLECEGVRSERSISHPVRLARVNTTAVQVSMFLR